MPPSSQQSVQPVGTVVAVPKPDLEVLRALHKSMDRVKSDSYDRLVAVITETHKAILPLFDEYRSRVVAIGVQQGIDTRNNDEGWTFNLDDGVITRVK